MTLTYEVHLRPAIAEDLSLESPIETARIDYYDAGIWVSRPDGRDFLPYEHVLVIRERPTTTPDDESTADGPTSEA